MRRKNYLDGKDVKEIRTGASGAQVFVVDGEEIVKWVSREDVEIERFLTYRRETEFYKSKDTEKATYLPKVLKAEASDDEIFLVLKKYEPLKREDLNEDVLRKIAGVLAQIHSDRAPCFLRRSAEERKQISEKEIAESVQGWKEVLSEHLGAFVGKEIDRIAARIEELQAWHETETRALVHGDFHWDNLLSDENGNILVCDWQNVKYDAPFGDLSFFLSRLGADGIEVDPEVFLSAYVDARRELGSAGLEVDEIKKHMAAANVLTSFLFWHRFLHGADADRVRGIYEKMVDGFYAVDLGGLV